ncbi:hypothetical protein C8J56DRAFT_1115242 [Mycena floridula]|nr:hypothetical protein C8J56DRAFT_1115242 [Mycena floridula]
MSDAQQSGPLSGSDIFALKEFLIRILVAIQFLVHGSYTTLVVIALYKLWTRKARLAARWILISAIFGMFLCATASAAIGLAYELVQLPTLGFNPPDVGTLLINMSTSNNAMVRVIYFISDSVVVWRAWILWTDHMWVHALLVICLLGSFAGATIDFTFGMLAYLGNTHFIATGPQTLILILPLFLTNLISTLLMGYKVWEYRAEIKKNLGIRRDKGPRSRVSLFSLLNQVLFTVYYGYQIISTLLPQLAAIYPIIIILLVAIGKTNLESTVTAPTFSQSIRFGSIPHVLTGTDRNLDHPSTNTQITSAQLDREAEEGVAMTTAEKKPFESAERANLVE